MPIISALGRHKQVCEFEVILGYIASLRETWDRQRNPVSRKPSLRLSSIQKGLGFVLSIIKNYMPLILTSKDFATM